MSVLGGLLILCRVIERDDGVFVDSVMGLAGLMLVGGLAWVTFKTTPTAIKRMFYF